MRVLLSSAPGLSVIINIDQAQYYGPLAQEAGVRLTVHDQSRMPFPEDEGISVMPGRQTYVGVKRVCCYTGNWIMSRSFTYILSIHIWGIGDESVVISHEGSVMGLAPGVLILHELHMSYINLVC